MSRTRATLETWMRRHSAAPERPQPERLRGGAAMTGATRTSHARTHTRTHARTHAPKARTHARTQARTHDCVIGVLRAAADCDETAAASLAPDALPAMVAHVRGITTWELRCAIGACASPAPPAHDDGAAERHPVAAGTATGAGHRGRPRRGRAGGGRRAAPPLRGGRVLCAPGSRAKPPMGIGTRNKHNPSEVTPCAKP